MYYNKENLSSDTSRIVSSYPICLLFENTIRRPGRVSQQSSKRKTGFSFMMRNRAKNGSWLLLKISSTALMVKSELPISARWMENQSPHFKTLSTPNDRAGQCSSLNFVWSSQCSSSFASGPEISHQGQSSSEKDIWTGVAAEAATFPVRKNVGKSFIFLYLMFLQSSFLSSSRSFHPFANILSSLRLFARPSFVSPNYFLLPPNTFPLIVQFAPLYRLRTVAHFRALNFWLPNSKL